MVNSIGNGGCGESCMSTIAQMNCVGVNMTTGNNPPVNPPINPTETQDIPVTISFVDKNNTPITENLPATVALKLIETIANKNATQANDYNVTFYNIPVGGVYDILASVDGYTTTVTQTATGYSVVFKSEEEVVPPSPQTKTYTAVVTPLDGLTEATIDLMNGTTKVESKTANASNSWTVTFTFEATNNYTISVDDVDGYSFEVAQNGDNWQITTYKLGPPPTSTTYNVHVVVPISITEATVNLMNGTEVVESKVANEANSFNVEFTFDTPETPYTVSMTAIDDYVFSVTNTGNNYTISVTFAPSPPPQETIYDVSLEFVGTDGSPASYNEDVSVYLKYGDDILQTATATSTNEYKVTFTYTDEETKPATVDGEDIAGYTKQVTNSGNDFTIIYTKEVAEP